MKKELAIARYKEDTSWIDQMSNHDYKVTIYNKFEGENLLQNVGRESHTYLNHIIQNYENLADFTVFLQGDPIHHCKDLYEKLQFCANQQYDFVFLSDGTITCDVNGRPGCGGAGVRHTPVGKLFEWITGKKSPQVFRSPVAAQFGVSKRMIHCNSKEFYERALITLSYDKDPIEGHCFERMWAALFGLHVDMSYKDLNYFNDNEMDVVSYLNNHIKNNEIILDGNLGPYAK